MRFTFHRASLLFLFAMFFSSISVSADTHAERDFGRAVREAWKTKECEQAKTLMQDMKTHASAAVYSFYQAEAFEFGHCVEKNIDFAISSYEKAYEHSQFLGAMPVALLYLREKNDPETAHKWFRMMAVLFGTEEQTVNESEGQYQISQMVKEFLMVAGLGDREFPEKEFKKALQWADALKKSKAERLYDYALIFEKGLNGYPAHHHASFKMLIAAVDLDYAPAAWDYVQDLLEDVRNKKRHFFSAMSALKIAAHGGIVDAQVEVGRLYRDINKNHRYLERAYEWFVFARKNGANIETEIENLETRIEPDKLTDIKRSIEQKGRVPK